MKIKHSVLAGAALAAIASLAGCTKAPPPPMITPPPVVVVPPQPQPPRGAPANLPVPPVDSFGVRQTINTHLTPAQTTWNLRSAFNVAALNCMQAEHTQILENYKKFLTSNAKKLTAVNKAVDQDFKARFGKGYVARRETYMTQVYNYFALPPTLPAFCDAALALGNQAQSVPSSELDAFAARSLPELDKVFLEFFRSYDQYRVDLAAWQAKYMASMPAPVAIQLPPAAPQPQAQMQSQTK